jgi:hypothetical protein
VNAEKSPSKIANTPSKIVRLEIIVTPPRGRYIDGVKL